MRRVLLAAILVLVLAGLVVLFWPDRSTPADVPEAPAAAASAVEGPVQPGALERTHSAGAAEAAARFEPRDVKVGQGAYGLHGMVVDEHGDPVPKAWVAAFSSPYPLLDFEVSLAEIVEKPLAFELEPVASTWADEHGKFALEGMPGRSTYLVARAPKRLTRGRQPVMPAEIGSEQGVLLHTVAGAELRGRVVDEFNAPVANAELFITPSLMYIVQAIRSKEIYVERLFTGADGTFFLEAVPAGIVLGAQAFDGVTHPGLREVGPLAQGSSVETQIRLAETGDLTATVTDEDGNPVGGAKAVAVPLDFRMAPALARDLPAWIAESRADGTVRWPRLPRRNYLLLAQAREGRSAPYAATVLGAGSIAPEALVLQVKSVVEGRLVDAKGRGIAGARVMLASIPSKPGEESGNDFGSGGMPSSAQIFLQLGKEVLPLILPSETLSNTDPAGRFRLPVWEGARLSVEVEGYPDTQYQLPDLEDRKAVLVLAPPGAVEGSVAAEDGTPVRFFAVNANLEASFLEPAPTDLAKQEGEDRRVFKARREQAEQEARQQLLGDLLAEDEVIVLPEETMLGEFLNTRLLDDGSGRFRIENLMPGRYAIEARAAGFVVARSDDITIEPGATVSGVQMTLKRGATISGRVVAAGTREPVAGALVWAGEGDQSGFTGMMFAVAEAMALDRTDADGVFELLGVAPGSDRIHATAEGFAPAMIKGRQLAEGDLREDVVLEMKSGGTIQGNVTDRHGQPLTARMVGGFAIDSQDFWQAPTNEVGFYKAANVKPGNYFILTAALDDEALFTGDLLSVLGGSRMAQAVVKDGQTVTVDIQDTSANAVKVRGRVVLPDGRTVTNASLFAMAAEASLMDLRMATARADAEGWFEFRSLAPGKYRLQVDSGDWQGSLDMEVPDQPEVELLLEAPDGVVSGLVVSAQTGQPVPAVTVMLVREDSALGFLGSFMPGGQQTEWGDTDEEGRFRFSGVAAGTYSLNVRADFRYALDDEDDQLEPLGRLEVPAFQVELNEAHDLGTLRLPIASAIVVRLTSSGRAEQEGFSIRVRRTDGDGGEEEEESWGWNGKGRISGLEPGQYDVTIRSRGHATKRVEGVQVLASQTTEVEVALVEGVPLAARVLDQNGQPLADAEIEVRDSGGGKVDALDASSQFLSGFFGGTDGSVPLGSFEPGAYRVRVTWQGQSREQGVALASGQQETEVVEFTFSR